MNEEKIFSHSQPLHSSVTEQSQPLKKMDKFRAINAWLLQIYPLCFRRKKPQPLKHTILEDILETYPFDDVLTCDNLRENLGWYRRRFQYLHVVIAKRPRIVLYGNVVGEVTDQEVEKALGQLRVLLQKNYDRLFYS